MVEKTQRLYAIGCLALGLNSFSFYKMKGVYCDSSDKQSPHEVFCLLDWRKKIGIAYDPSLAGSDDLEFCLSNWRFYNKYQNICFFLYDENTFTSMSLLLLSGREETRGTNIVKDLALPSPKLLEFLNCKFDYSDGFFSNKNIRSIIQDRGLVGIIHKKEYLLFSNDHRIIKSISPILKDKVNTLCNSDVSKFDNYVSNPLFLRERLQSFSGVNIINTENGVFLNRSDTMANQVKVVNMTKALKKYFVKSFDQHDLIKLISTYCSSGERGEKKLNAREVFNFNHRKSLNKDDYDRLQASTLLAVWALISKQKKILDKEGNEFIKTIESEMIGLARDERTQELFHWVTDLSQDISVLMNYQS